LTKITVTLQKDLRIFMIISRQIFVRMRNFWEKFVEKIKTEVLFSKTFSETRAV